MCFIDLAFSAEGTGLKNTGIVFLAWVVSGSVFSLEIVFIAYAKVTKVVFTACAKITTVVVIA